MSHYPSVYPSEVKYRPGRIQSLDAEQEIILKQCWASFMTYWGYEICISSDDIRSKDSFVASSATRNAPKMTRRQSVETIRAVKKKKSFFSKSPKQIRSTSQKRVKQIEAADSERHEAVEEPSEFVRYVYTHHYKQAFQYSDDYFSDDDDVSSLNDDAESMQTYYTAATTPSVTTALGSVVQKAKTPSGTFQVKARPSVLPGMAKYKPQVVHKSMCNLVKNDLIDNLVLRYIRARKYVYEDAMVMITSSLHWKETEYPVDQWLREADGPSFVKGTNKGFVKNFTVGKSAIRGHDKKGNPLFMFQSRKHFAHDSPLESTERFAVVIIEWCRLFLREVTESVDLCSVMFDLTGFSMKNSDNAPIKFLTAMFEAHYPESLGIIIVHNAPWIFSTVWNIIKNWLDPVVLSKIHFTKGYEDLKEFIDPEHIPSYLGGEGAGEVPYPEPTKNDVVPPKKKDAEYRQLRLERDELFMRFIEVTRKWVESANPEVSSQYLRDKIQLSYQMSDNYIALDPYIRNPGVYDRDGTLTLRN